MGTVTLREFSGALGCDRANFQLLVISAIPEMSSHGSVIDHLG